MYAKLRSALSRLGGADAIVMQSIVGYRNVLEVPTWRLERDSNPRPFRQKATNLPMSHTPHCYKSLKLWENTTKFNAKTSTEILNPDPDILYCYVPGWMQCNAMQCNAMQVFQHFTSCQEKPCLDHLG